MKKTAGCSEPILICRKNEVYFIVLTLWAIGGMALFGFDRLVVILVALIWGKLFFSQFNDYIFCEEGIYVRYPWQTLLLNWDDLVRADAIVPGSVFLYARKLPLRYKLLLLGSGSLLKPAFVIGSFRHTQVQCARESLQIRLGDRFRRIGWW